MWHMWPGGNSAHRYAPGTPRPTMQCLGANSYCKGTVVWLLWSLSLSLSQYLNLLCILGTNCMHSVNTHHSIMQVWHVELKLSCLITIIQVKISILTESYETHHNLLLPYEDLMFLLMVNLAIWRYVKQTSCDFLCKLSELPKRDCTNLVT